MSILFGAGLAEAIINAMKFPGAGDEHLQWRSSGAYRRLRNWTVVAFVWLASVVLTVAVLSLFSASFIHSFTSRTRPQRTFGIVLTILAAIFPIGWIYARFIDARQQFLEQVRAGMLKDLAKRQGELRFDPNGRPNFASLWDLTQDRINIYHSIATRQSETSFRVGIGATIAGFAAVLALGIVAAFSRGGTAALAASVVGVAGAAMTGYIGSTFMKAQSEASAQLQQFFLQPVEFFRMLGLERLLDLMTPAEKATAIQRMVDSMMPASTLTPPPVHAAGPINSPGLYRRILDRALPSKVESLDLTAPETPINKPGD